MTRSRVALAVLLVLVLAGPGMGQVGGHEQLLNPNLASVEELAGVPHVDGARAEAIVAGRPYLDMTSLHAVAGAGLSEEQLDELYAALWLPIDLNSASEAEIGLIPGVGPRMTKEFEEYRPYIALEQFRRAMSKYVDDAEVARLDQYVFVPMNLNEATEEDFHTIPGVGDRMVGEFLEYRPYASMEQFRREIGKYVDDAEVARLARYMTLGDS